MEKINYSVFRAQMTNVMDKVNSDQQPIMITRKNGKHAVLMSVEYFQSYEETAYLGASAANALRVNRSISEINSTISIRKKRTE